MGKLKKPPPERHGQGFGTKGPGAVWVDEAVIGPGTGWTMGVQFHLMIRAMCIQYVFMYVYVLEYIYIYSIYMLKL